MENENLDEVILKLYDQLRNPLMKNEIYEPFPMLNKEITANIIDFENIGISGEQYKKLRERDLHQFQVIEKILTLKKKQEINMTFPLLTFP